MRALLFPPFCWTLLLCLWCPFFYLFWTEIGDNSHIFRTLTAGRSTLPKNNQKAIETLLHQSTPTNITFSFGSPYLRSRSSQSHFCSFPSLSTSEICAEKCCWCYHPSLLLSLFRFFFFFVWRFLPFLFFATVIVVLVVYFLLTTDGTETHGDRSGGEGGVRGWHHAEPLPQVNNTTYVERDIVREGSRTMPWATLCFPRYLL